MSPERLRRAKEANYRIHTGLVRRVGYKLGKGFPADVLRDEKTGLQIIGEGDKPELNTDFSRVRTSFDEFSGGTTMTPIGRALASKRS